MRETGTHLLAYHVIRYIPNLIRDEWVNVGVVVYDTAERRYRVRVIEEESEFARLRRLHPSADEGLVRGLNSLFDSSLAQHREGLSEWVAKLDSVLSNAVQFSKQTGLLGADLDAELERLYHNHVEPPRASHAAGKLPNTRSTIRAQANQVFRAVGLWGKLNRSVRVDEYTYPGDPLRLDYSYRRNGTRGFVQSLALSRDPSHAKILAYTADSIREKIEHSEFVAITEMEPHAQDNDRHKFIAGLLAEKEIPLVPLSQLPVWAYKMKAVIQ
jgi:hypothetical protein